MRTTLYVFAHDEIFFFFFFFFSKSKLKFSLNFLHVIQKHLFTDLNQVF